jgi:3,4-dihydroxy-2-butanone 4-phosphate synthase
MKKYRKSIWLPVALLVYTTAMAVYFIPRNTEISDTEKYLTVRKVLSDYNLMTKMDMPGRQTF